MTTFNVKFFLKDEGPYRSPYQNIVKIFVSSVENSCNYLYPIPLCRREHAVALYSIHFVTLLSLHESIRTGLLKSHGIISVNCILSSDRYV